jgi:hypothetical protein
MKVTILAIVFNKVPARNSIAISASISVATLVFGRFAVRISVGTPTILYGFSCFSSNPPGKSQASDHATAVSFHILSKSFPIIQLFEVI